MDWSGCDLVEVVPGKVSGKPIVRGTRIPADVIVSNSLAGLNLSEIQKNYPSLNLETVRQLLDYAKATQEQRSTLSAAFFAAH